MLKAAGVKQFASGVLDVCESSCLESCDVPSRIVVKTLKTWTRSLQVKIKTECRFTKETLLPTMEKICKGYVPPNIVRVTNWAVDVFERMVDVSESFLLVRVVVF